MTYAFYRSGWRGINIEPRPGSKSEFDLARPRDINIEVAVGDAAGQTTYYEFNEPLFNGLYPEHTEEWQRRHGCTVVSEHRIPLVRLDELLDRHLPAGQQIDFLSIDVEGGELSVLRSNNWQRYRPEVVLVEDLRALRLNDVAESAATQFLCGEGYAPISKARYTIVYRLNDRIDATMTD
jgi:FkbM family methyltransferase